VNQGYSDRESSEREWSAYCEWVRAQREPCVTLNVNPAHTVNGVHIESSKREPSAY
jgi:hypothetical protein